jgi:predicted PurR-regulated permease PerM
MANEARAPTPIRFPVCRAVFLAAALYVFIGGFAIVSPILLSFLLILLIALAVNPLVSRLRRMIAGGRPVATAVVMLAFLTLAGLAGWGFYMPVKRAATKFVERLPEYWERVQRPLLRFEQRAAMSGEKVKREVTTEVAREEAERTGEPVVVAEPEPPSPEVGGGLFQTGLSGLLSGATHGFRSVATSLAALMVVAVTVLFGVIFTLLNPRPIISTIFAMIPEKHHRTAVRIAQRIIHMIPRWALATLLGMSVIGTLVFLAMWPIFGFQDALVLGVIAMVFEVIPYLGPILAVLPAILLALGEGGWTPLWVILAYSAIQMLENNVVSPVVVGGRLHLHPLGVVFSILICVAVFGMLGVLVAVPAVAVFNIVHEELYRKRYLPNVSDERLELLARVSLNDKTAPSPFGPEEAEPQAPPGHDHRSGEASS